MLDIFRDLLFSDDRSATLRINEGQMQRTVDLFGEVCMSTVRWSPQHYSTVHDCLLTPCPKAPVISVKHPADLACEMAGTPSRHINHQIMQALAQCFWNSNLIAHNDCVYQNVQRISQLPILCSMLYRVISVNVPNFILK